MMEKPLKRSRCAEQGHVYFLPHDGYRHVNLHSPDDAVISATLAPIQIGISTLSWIDGGGDGEPSG